MELEAVTLKRIHYKMPAKIISKLVVPGTTAVSISSLVSGYLEATDLVLQPLVQTGVLRLQHAGAGASDGIPLGAIGANFVLPTFMSMRGQETWDLEQMFLVSNQALDSVYIMMSVRAGTVER